MLQIYSVSDRAIQIDWPVNSAVCPTPMQLAAWVRALADYMRSLQWPEFQLVQADRCVSVIFAKPPGTAGLDTTGMALQLEPVVHKLAKKIDRQRSETRSHVIPVSYGGPAGQDLQWLAEQIGSSTEALIELHSSAVYTVEFLGFLPGFAYLSGLPRQLHFPRRSSPRPRVPAGTLAIGAHYCAVYPWESPGGWHLLGHVKQALFNPESHEGQGHSLLQAGDTVQFVRAQHA
jgi:5-oxoprolinase (ATP-hydrolysing) subunit B